MKIYHNDEQEKCSCNVVSTRYCKRTQKTQSQNEEIIRKIIASYFCD